MESIQFKDCIFVDDERVNIEVDARVLPAIDEDDTTDGIVCHVYHEVPGGKNDIIEMIPAETVLRLERTAAQEWDKMHELVEVSRCNAE